jgi:Cu-processing system permease protein
MLGRIFAIAMNTYREAVRARVLFALLAVAIAAALYSLVIAAMSLRQEQRIVADLGSSATSLAAIATTIVLGATSLHRELELKTIFPILTRRLRRHEYIIGKYVGIVATLFVFIAINGAVTLAILAAQDKAQLGMTLGVSLGSILTLAVALWRLAQTRSFVIIPWSIAVYVVMAVLAAPAGPERQVVFVMTALSLGEVAIIAAVAMVFSSFSSPFLTAIFTVMVWLIGRSGDTLAHLPARVFGSTITTLGVAIARVVPNLNLYVPVRPLMLGQLPNVSVPLYVLRAWGNSLAYIVVLLAFSTIIFRKRDFQ